jgi:hypothetical protein
LELKKLDKEKWGVKNPEIEGIVVFSVMYEDGKLKI